MSTRLAVTVAVTATALLAGCAAHQSSPSTDPHDTTPTPSASVQAAARSVCAAFHDFYGLLAVTPPRGHQAMLVASAERMLHAKGGSRRQFHDAVTLVSYVASSAFPLTGNIDGGPVQRMTDDCP